MPRNGSGVYTPPANSVNPAVPDTEINADDFNDMLADLSEAMTDSIASDGQTTITADLPMAGFKLTGLGTPSSTGDSLAWGRTARTGVLSVNGAAIGTAEFSVTGRGVITSSSNVETRVLTMSRDKDDTSRVTLSNTNGGNGASAQLELTNGTSSALLTQFGTGYAVSAPFVANATSFFGGSGGLIIGTLNTSPLTFQYNAATVGSWTSSAFTVSTPLNYGGVTLSNAVTGTGNMVLSASPTLSGTIGGNLTFSGAHTLSSALTYGGVTLSNSVTGTGSMVLSSGPALTGAATVGGTLINTTGNGFRAIPATTTEAALFQFTNGGGTSYVGVDNSTGGTFGKGAYVYHVFNGANTAMVFETNGTEFLRGNAAGGANVTGPLQLGNAYVATPQVSTGYVTIKDSTGTTYKVLVAP